MMNENIVNGQQQTAQRVPRPQGTSDCGNKTGHVLPSVQKIN